jgi:predicted negative regulator of RcsB-dependent stress response
VSYTTDDEQVEALKRWWQENGRSVIAGVVLALAGVIGWQQWGSYQERRAEAASAEYSGFVQQIQATQVPEGVVGRGEAIIAEYRKTPYATLTALWLAQHHADQGALEPAAEQLRWVVQNGDSDSLRHIARLRLGRLLLGAGEHQQALDALRTGSEGAFRSQYQELRGDIHLALGDTEAAVRAYQAALSDEGIDGQRRGLIELKLVDLGVEPAEPLS